MHRFIFPALIPLFVLGCAPVSTDSTRITLTIEYEEAWNIDLIEVRSRTDENEHDEQLPAQPTLEIEVPDSWAGQEVHLQIRGLRGTEDAIATGSGTVLPMLGTSTPLTIRLRRVQCGAWCTLGETRCFGDAVARCEQNDADGCMRWDEPYLCPTDAPFCSLGQCRAQCIDECAEGEQRCDGPHGHQRCGDFDADPCREWSTTTTCSEDQSCHAGTCITGECRDQCTSGARECRGNAVITCGDLNGDGCSEWSPSVRCPTGDTPPEPTCIDANTLRVYDPVIECSASSGRCSYTSTDMPCLLGCSAGRCEIGSRTLEAYLKASNTGNNDSFGISVSFSGDLLAVGAYGESSSSTGVDGDQDDDSLGHSGAVYVFARSASGAWTQEAYIKASNTGAVDSFGSSVSLSGNLLAVSAPGEDSSSTGIGGDQDDNATFNSGAVYVFARSASGTWAQEAYIKASNTDGNDDFGISVSLSGDLLAVGASNEDSSSTGIGGDQDNSDAAKSGAVYVFARSASGTWAQEAYIKASNTDAEDFFGSSVSLSGDLLAVSAPGEDSSSTGVGGDQDNSDAANSGAVYVFARSASGTWAQEAYIKASNTDAEDFFGSSVSLSGDLLVVSALGEDSSSTGVGGDQANNDTTNSGAAYVFRRSASGTWTQEAYLKASNTGEGDRFGDSLALFGDLLAVAAPGEDSSSIDDQADDSMDNSGAVYIFRRSPAGPWAQEVYLKAPNIRGDRFGSSISLSGDLLVVGAAQEYSSATGVNGEQTGSPIFGSGAVFVYR